MSLTIQKVSYMYETPPATPFPPQQHLGSASSAQDLQPQGRQPQHIPSIKRSKLDPWSQRLGEETVKQFEELACNFTELDNVEDIANWSFYLLEQLKDEKLVDEYNAWSNEYFKPPPCVDKVVKENPADVFLDFKICLFDADWNHGDNNLDVVSSMMIYGRRLHNEGLFALGTIQRFWLILRLNMWAISPQKTDPQLRELYGVADGHRGEILGLRYRPIGDESTASVLFFFPLGGILYTETFESDPIPDDDNEQWMDVPEWLDVAEGTDIPFILALGIQDNGRTERLDDGQGQFYLIHNPTHNSDISHNPAQDSDDDVQDIIFCRNPPPYTVARVKERSKEFLTPRISLLQSGTNIDLEPLSLSTPEIVETSTTEDKYGRKVRFGLFPK